MTSMNDGDDCFVEPLIGELWTWDGYLIIPVEETAKVLTWSGVKRVTWRCWAVHLRTGEVTTDEQWTWEDNSWYVERWHCVSPDQSRQSECSRDDLD